MHSGWSKQLTGFISSARKAPPILENEQLFTKWEAAGHFWLPERPEGKLWGKVSFSPGDKVSVVLEGNLGRRHQTKGILYPTLNGILFNGAHCTLFDSICYVESYFSDREYQRSTLHSSLMLLGGHFASPSDVRLQSLSMKFSHLDDWFREPYDLQYKRGGFEKSLVCFSPDTFKIETSFESESFCLSSFCQRQIPFGSKRGKLEFSSRYILIAEPKTDQSLSLFLSLASSLRSYLMLLIGCGVYTLELEGMLANTTDANVEISSEPDKAPPAIVQIYLPVCVPTVVQGDTNCFASSYNEMSKEFTTGTNGWFKHKEILETATRAYTELLQYDGASEESVFLRVVQTLEHLHGVIFSDNSKYVPKPKWKKFQAWLAENVPNPLARLWHEDDAESKDAVDHGQLRKIVLDRIGSLNQLSFRSRLEMLFRKIPRRYLMPILDNPSSKFDEELDEFLRAVEATRNYLTHYTSRQKKTALKKEDMEEATARCWAVLSYWIATYIGFSEEISGTMALKAKRAMFLVANKTEL